jgi:hypothetical protein
VPRFIAWIVALFAVGMICGWSARPYLSSRGGSEALASPSAAKAQGATTSASNEAPKDSAAPSDFFSRVHAALSIPARRNRARAIQGVADGLNAAQIQEALGRLEKIRIPHRDEIVAQLLARWGELDPQAAIEFARLIAKAPAQREAVNAVLGAWVENDAASAERWVAELPEGMLQNSAWEGLIKALATADPKRALLLAGKCNLPWQNAEVIADGIFPHWIAVNPEEAAKHALELEDGALRNVALRTVARQWARTSLPEALAWADSLPDQDFTVKMLNHTGSTPIYALLDAWIEKDPAAVVSWLSQLPEGDKKAALSMSACTFLMSENPTPQLAMQLAMMLPEGAQRNGALQQLASQVASWNPAAALEWLHLPMEAAQRGVILSGLISHLSGDELMSALQFAERLDASGKENAISIKSSDGRLMWNLADPATLAKWAEKQPNNQEYLNRIASSWTQRDPDGASRWLQTLPSPARDAALRGILDEAFFRVPIDTPLDTARHFQEAERWIQHLSSMQAREAAYEKLAERWVKMDSEFARAWLKDSPLSQATKDRLSK